MFIVLLINFVMAQKGATCWVDRATRGVGRLSLKGCSLNEQKEAGLCYPLCPAKYHAFGPLCFSDCPSDVPYRCGLLCTGDNGTCSDQTAALSFAGFEVVYGLALFGVSLGTAIGSAGASSFVSGFGIVAGVGTIGMGWSDIARKLIEYPFCSNDTERAQMMAELDHNQKIFPSKLAETCSYLFPNTTTQ